MTTNVSATTPDGEVSTRTLPPESASGHWGGGLRLWVARLVLLGAFFGLWEFASGRWIEEFWLSKPTLIVETIVEWVASGFLFLHLLVTLQEMALGLIVGASLGIAAGFVLGSNRFLGRLLDPIVSAVYSLPKLALAPLFILWFGIGLEMKVAFTATLVFFLVFWNTYAGVRDVDEELIGVLRVMGAGRRAVISKVILPGAMDDVYVGLRLAVPYSLVGAVVAELIASNRGLGYLIQSQAAQFNVQGVMAVVFILMFIAVIMNTILDRSERHVLRWKAAGKY